jgi:hypothetical protein
MRREVFGMRRANGDWFVLEAAGQSRVLLFRDLAVAWRARAINPELMLFWPTPIDERALAEFATAEQGQEDPAADLQHGHPLEYMQLATIEHVTNLPVEPVRKAMRKAAAQ